MTSKKVTRWLESHRTANTRERYYTGLMKLSSFYKVTPDQILKWDVDTIENNIQDWIVKMRDKERLGRNSIITHINGVKSWLRFNKIRNVVIETRSIPNGGRSLKETPTQEELRQILDAVGLKHKLMISLSAFAGLRPVDIAELKYKDIKDSFENGDDVLTIIKEQRKTREVYASFLGYQGTRYLRDYIGKRKLKPNEYILEWRGKRINERGVRRAMDVAIINSVGKHPRSQLKTLEPYSFRRYFKNRTIAAGMNESESEYLMGHKNGLQSLAATYGGLRNLDDEAIKRLKEIYISILPDLETEISEHHKPVELSEDMKRAFVEYIKNDPDFWEFLEKRKIKS